MLVTAPAIEPWLDPELASHAAVEDVTAGKFSFLGESHTLQPGFNWTANPSRDIEWLILLHKFYFAPGLGLAYRETGDLRFRETWIELARSWIRTVPVDFLSSDVTGRRIQNWIYAHQLFGEIPGFHVEFVASLRQQCAWLRANLSPARNHRTLELLALFLMGVALPDSSDLLDFARTELAANLHRDFHPDGVHVEQSTDYHHLVLRNALVARRVADANGIEMPEQFDAAIRRALRFSAHIHRPDGIIPSLSDGDSGSFLDLLRYGAERYDDPLARYVASGGREGAAPAGRMAAFPDGGYYVMRSGWNGPDERWLVFDCGPLGQGNHGHLDLLSFELYAHGHALIVDPGRYTYDESGDVNWRVAFRGTAFHNTITVDGRNQTRYEFHKRKFKVLGPEPAYRVRALGEDFIRAEAASAEYDAIHEREIRLVDGDLFTIADTLTSPTEHVYDLRFHLNTSAEGDVTLTSEGASLFINSPRLAMRITSSHAMDGIIEPGWISPSYGVKQPAPVVRVRARGANVCFQSVLIPEK
jgi:uncharacterized heparinase superfamily protein